MKKYLISGIMLFAVFVVGFITGRNSAKTDAPQVVKKSAITYDFITTDVKKMKRVEIENELYKFYMDAPELDIVPLYNKSPFTHRLKAKLNKREWRRDVKIKCHSTTAWTMYFSLVGASAIAGGIIAYKLFKK